MIKAYVFPGQGAQFVQTNTMIYAALPEFYAILALVAAIMIK